MAEKKKKTYTFTNPKGTFTSETPTAGASSSGISEADVKKLIEDALDSTKTEITTLKTNLQQCLSQNDFEKFYTSARDTDFQGFYNYLNENFASKEGHHGTITAINALFNMSCIDRGIDKLICDKHSYDFCIEAIGVIAECQAAWPV